MPGSQRWPQYGTARWRRTRAALLAGSPKCFWGCGRLATTADHNPPLEQVGQWHWDVVPACGPCNFGRRGKVPASSTVGSASREW